MAVHEHAPGEHAHGAVPPAAGPAVPIELDLSTLKQCVHCGLCLDYCPTYRVNGLELDSPRGRIYQVRGVYRGDIDPNNEDFREHIYRCLDCRACETACPSGVKYGEIVEAARGLAPPADAAERTIGRTVLNRIFTSKLALNALGLGMRVYQKLGVQTRRASVPRAQAAARAAPEAGADAAAHPGRRREAGHAGAGHGHAAPADTASGSSPAA